MVGIVADVGSLSNMPNCLMGSWNCNRICLRSSGGGQNLVAVTRSVPRPLRCHLAVRRCRHLVANASRKDEPGEDIVEDEFFEGLLPQDDYEVPGNSLSLNTPSGQAIDSACKELDTLRELEMENLQKAEDLLKQLGFKGSLFAIPKTAEGGEEGGSIEEEEGTEKQPA